jgi:hypothetical protein
MEKSKYLIIGVEVFLLFSVPGYLSGDDKRILNRAEKLV